MLKNKYSILDSNNIELVNNENYNTNNSNIQIRTKKVIFTDYLNSKVKMNILN